MKTIDIQKDAEDRYDEIVSRTKAWAESAREGAHQEIDREFVFNTTNGPLTLADSFRYQDDLIVIHNMGTACSWCAMWADGFNGVRKHLEDRAALLLLSPDDPETVAKFAKARGWGFPVASARNSGFNEFIQFGKSDDMDPGFSTFHKDAEGRITRISTECFGDFDLFSPVWHMIARLKDGIHNWEPEFEYAKPS